jgi:uracil-DNA glycosylase family 4
LGYRLKNNQTGQRAEVEKIGEKNTAALAQIAEDVRKCMKCRLHETRTNAVPGEGAPEADILLLGEGPGGTEDQQGRPFVGQAGKLLEELLATVGLAREEIFITNVVKCRPPNNRPPRKDEIRACRPYLQKQLAILQPNVIGTLGNHATETILGETGIGKLHGRKFRREGYIIIPLYHPAAGLYNPELRPVMEKDIKRLVEA